jgi:transposase InsO family protein
MAESFFATIKTELLDRRPWPIRTVAHKAIFNWIEGWSNTRRRHSTLDFLSPQPTKPGSTRPTYAR